MRETSFFHAMPQHHSLRSYTVHDIEPEILLTVARAKQQSARRLDVSNGTLFWRVNASLGGPISGSSWSGGWGLALSVPF